jgi:hypothetical protein
MAGTISVPKSTHKIITVESGSGIWKIINIRKGAISGILDERV